MIVKCFIRLTTGDRQCYDNFLLSLQANERPYEYSSQQRQHFHLNMESVRPDWATFESSCKSSPNIWQLFGLLWKASLISKKAIVAAVWATFGTIWATFYSSIWSHCMESGDRKPFWCLRMFCIKKLCTIVRLENKSFWSDREITLLKQVAAFPLCWFAFCCLLLIVVVVVMIMIILQKYWGRSMNSTYLLSIVLTIDYQHTHTCVQSHHYNVGIPITNIYLHTH